DSLYNENIEYVEASPYDFEVVSLEVAKIVIPEEEEIEDDNLQISSGSTTTHSDISLSNSEAFSFNNDHIKEISSGSTTTHSDISLSEYDSFTFDLSNDQCPPTDRRDFTHEEFTDELAHIISLPEYDCFYFRDLPDPGELIFIFNSGIRENLSTTCVNLPIEDDDSPLLAYVVWIFLAYLTYPVITPYLHPFRNEDTIFDPGITINHFCSFKPGLSHRCGAFKKFNTHSSHLNEWPMIINGKNIPILDVLLIPRKFKTLAKGFYPLSLHFLRFNWESNKVIKSSVENLVPIPREFEGIPDTMCDVHLVNNQTPLEAKDRVEIVTNSNDDISSSDDDSLHEENIEYVEASPQDSELVSLEAAKIVIPEVEEIEDDNLREKLLNFHLLIANIE
nr:hypothetical protein [Tanacetum cinerariifolium]